MLNPLPYQGHWSLSQQSFAKPGGKFGLRHEAACDTFHDTDCVNWVKTEAVAVIGQKQARRDPGSALVAIHKAMVFRKTVGIRRGQISRIGRAVIRGVDGAGERAFDAPRITKTLGAAMFGQLPIVDGSDDGRIHPTPVLSGRGI